MKMKIKEVVTYEFNELNEKAKQKAMDYHRDINVRDEWYNYLLVNLTDTINENIGLELEPSMINFEFMSRNNSIWVENKDLMSALCKKYPEIADFDLPNKFGLFCNYLGGGMSSGLMKSEFKMELLSFYEEIDELRAVVLRKTIEKDLIDLQNRLEIFYKNLYESYNHLVSDESVGESLELNEFEFDESGDRI